MVLFQTLDVDKETYKYSNYRANNKLIVYVQNKNKNQSEKIVECIPITYLFANRVRSDF